MEDLVKKATTKRDKRLKIRAEIRRMAGDAVTLGWKYWSETMLAGLTGDLLDDYGDIIREELPAHSFFFKDAPRPQASVRLKDDWDGEAVYRKSPKMSAVELEVVRNHLQEMLGNGVLAPSSSP